MSPHEFCETVASELNVAEVVFPVGTATTLAGTSADLDLVYDAATRRFGMRCRQHTKYGDWVDEFARDFVGRLLHCGHLSAVGTQPPADPDRKSPAAL